MHPEVEHQSLFFWTLAHLSSVTGCGTITLDHAGTPCTPYGGKVTEGHIYTRALLNSEVIGNYRASSAAGASASIQTSAPSSSVTNFGTSMHNADNDTSVRSVRVLSGPPVPNPQRPKPHFSWDTIPIVLSSGVTLGCTCFAQDALRYEQIWLLLNSEADCT